MLVSVYPPLSPSRLEQEVEASRLRELEWLLSSLQDTFAAVREGLQECVALLASRDPGLTLVVSTPRSDSLKGFVTRLGTALVRADMQVRMTGLPSVKGGSCFRLTLSTADAFKRIGLAQLGKVVEYINQSLDVVDVTTWTGNAKDARFISGQLRLLLDTIRDACQELKGRPGERKGWLDNDIDPKLFDPPLPENLSFGVSICEAAVRVELRTLVLAAAADSALSAFSFRDRIAVAIGASKRPDHDEVDDVFIYRGQEVRVREKVTVESQDPGLIATMTKLAALEHNVAAAQQRLAIVMGEDL